MRYGEAHLRILSRKEDKLNAITVIPVALNMNTKPLNVVYIGSPSFPNGFAMTKRRRYMVDYMNAQGIQSHVLVCNHKKNSMFDNPHEGTYGLCTYFDVTPWAIKKNFYQFYKQGKTKLKKWFVEGKQNILLFSTRLALLHIPFYLYAKRLGYKVVFDQVETSFIAIGGKMSLKRRANEWLADKITSFVMNNSASFVISSALQRQSIQEYPDIKLCLLPNATPSLRNEEKLKLHTPLRVVYSGTFASKDGVEYLIDGCIKAKHKGCNLELFLMGKGQPWDMKVLDKLEDCDWARYLGFVSDEELLQQIQNGDVLCMTRNNSLFANYGFPFKLSEYLATGNILLATRIGDVEMYVKDKKSAYIIDPENSDQIADALIYIVQHPEEAIIVAQNGYKVMEQHFSINHVGEKFVNFLNSL